MTYEFYRTIFVLFAILSALMLILSIILLVVLKIPTVIGDLTGTNARKAIAIIRNQNVGLNDVARESANIRRYTTQKLLQETQTDDNETTLLSNETVLLNESVKHTNETVVLPHVTSSSYEPEISFELEVDITYIHTNEIIE